MTTLNPGFTNRWTDSGDAATRFSKGKVSFGTPTVNWSYGVPLGGAPSALRARQHVAVRPCLKLRATRNKDVVAVMIQYSVFSIQNCWMGLDWLIDFETTKYGRACNGQEWDGSFSLFVFRPPIQAKTLHVEEFKIQMRSVWSPSSKILTLLHSSSFSTNDTHTSHPTCTVRYFNDIKRRTNILRTYQSTNATGSMQWQVTGRRKAFSLRFASTSAVVQYLRLEPVKGSSQSD